jgi:hypothetical protein
MHKLKKHALISKENPELVDKTRPQGVIAPCEHLPADPRSQKAPGFAEGGARCAV